jgi:hypothetical protein
MVRLKQGITGFIYDSSNGVIKNITTIEVDMKTVGQMLGEDDVYITDQDADELFMFESKEQLDNNYERLNRVLEWVD